MAANAVYFLFAFLLAVLHFVIDKPEPLDFWGGLTVNFVGDIRIADVYLFADAGSPILSGNLSETYAHSANQVGPVQSVLAALLISYATKLGFPLGWEIFQFVLILFTVFSSAFLTSILSYRLQDLYSNVWLKRVVLAAPILVIALLEVFSYPLLFYFSGHYWQVAVALLWAAAGWLLYKGKVLLPALFLATTIGFEPWGVFGLVMLLLAPSVRNFLSSGLIAILGGLAFWMPFVLSGHFTMLEHEWQVKEESLWTIFYEAGSDFPIGLRIAQTLIILSIVTSLTILVKARLGAFEKFIPGWWITIILAVSFVLARTATDAVYLWYYTSAAKFLLIPVAVVLLLGRQWKVGVPVALAAYLVSFALSPFVSLLLTISALVLLCIAVLLTPRQDEIGKLEEKQTEEVSSN